MGDFRSFRSSRRAPARAMEPVVDPAGWSPEDLRDVASWTYRISEQDIDDLAEGVKEVRRRRVPIVEIAREHFPLGAFADALADVRRELLDGRGIVMLQDFPI